MPAVDPGRRPGGGATGPGPTAGGASPAEAGAGPRAHGPAGEPGHGAHGDHAGGDGHGEHGHGGHGHGHGHEHRRGVLGAVAGLFRPHSHDAADSIDSALDSDARGIRAVKLSFAALMATAAVQVLVVAITGSVALLADTIHNFSDALTAVPLFLAFRFGSRPPTRRHTYGFRRSEDLAGVFVVLMIAASAALAAYEAVDRLLHPRSISHVGAVLAAGVIGFLGNEAVALFRIREGRAIGSAALVADGYHARTDGFTSLAVALGAIGVWVGFDRADPIVGLAISAAILVILWDAARQVFRRLMDAVDPDVVEQAEQVAAATPGVRRVGSMRVRWLGHRLVGEACIEVDGDLSVREGHAIAEEVHHRMLHDVRHLDELTVHVDSEDPTAHDGSGHHRS